MMRIFAPALLGAALAAVGPSVASAQSPAGSVGDIGLRNFILEFLPERREGSR